MSLTVFHNSVHVTQLPGILPVVEPRRVRCSQCSGYGFHWVARLRDPRQDDGQPHTVFCWRCKGTGVFPPRKK